MVDTVMVGQIGDVALSAVGMAGQWSWLMNCTIFGFCSGAVVFISQYWGVGDRKSIHNYLGIMLLHSLLVALAGFAAVVINPTAIIQLFNREPAVVSEGVRYIKIAKYSYPALAFGTALSFTLRSTEDVKTPMFVSFFTTVANAVINYGLIFGHFGLPEMGIAGAALATVISSWLGPITLVVIACFKKDCILRAKLSEILFFGREKLRRFYRISSPVVANEVVWSLGSLIVNIILAQLGYENYAAVTIFRTVDAIAFSFFIGLCNASSVLVGKNIGAGNIKEGLEIAKRFVVLVPICALFTALCIIVLRRPIVGLFSLNDSLSAGTASMARWLLVIYAAEFTLRAIPYITIVGIFRPGGDTKTGMILDLCCVYLMQIPLTALAAFVVKADFRIVFGTMLFGEDFVKVFLCIFRFRSRKWVQPITDEGKAAARAFGLKVREG